MKDQEILHTRAAQLAIPLQQQSSDPTQVVLLIEVASETYALPAKQIETVRALGTLTRLPGVGSVISGMITLQGHVLSVLDLAALLGNTPDEQAGYIVVYQHAGQRVALKVREAREVVSIPLQLSRPPNLRPGLVGVWEARITLLDLDTLLEDFSHQSTFHQTGGASGIL
ncbi:chemotaxis protein CheW [Deinococcus roseus]|uniref:CheW-like domain-containing protein n=1 Tax=Deinococcus roseus TaxID=392414 RepID=A0ABQ2D2S7_9DEIO|nr:chemotaxis protein CheW [Deinococcus roseus]GGJ39225.1 hypothetical protein GCM10008938_26560 [Deinococcus roseus]